ncbi:MAG: cob(I)yrinic acid a,c-diamide adenosyltransferase [Chloroflexi bacterium]|nr:cob(I)yrinic acid a,c-diamide adenosyltransferase [Chloroflexota bacterium]
MAEKVKRGLIQVYTGEGKGKTTAALGLAVRATGRGMKVGFIQFLKGRASGEHLFLSQYPAFKIVHMSVGSSFNKPREQMLQEARLTFAYAEEQLLSGNYDLLILDEIFLAIHKELITTEQLLNLLDKKPDSLELVLTGRHAPPEIVQRADLVTEMRKIKHPFSQGIRARRGIEF